MNSRFFLIAVFFVAFLALGAAIFSLNCLAADPPASPPPNFWQTVKSSADSIAALVVPILITIAGIGTASMALLQAFKDLFYIRRWFNRRKVRDWLLRRVQNKTCKDAANNFDPRGLEGPDLQKAQSSLARLTTGSYIDGFCPSQAALTSLETLATAGDSNALYSLDVDKLSLQIGVAGRMALDHPATNLELIFALTYGAPPQDRTDALTSSQPAPKDRSSYLDAKNRLVSYMQSTLDGLGLMLTYKWTWWNQLAALILNVIFFFSLWYYFQPTPDVRHLLGAVAAAFLGAFIAPVAKDLVTALQSLKDARR